MLLDELRARVDKNKEYRGEYRDELKPLEEKLQSPEVWADQKLASELGQKVREIKETIALFEGWDSILEDAKTAYEIGD